MLLTLPRMSCIRYIRSYIIDFSLYAVFKVHKDASGCKNSSALKACFHKQVCFCRHWHVMPWAIRPKVLELRICFWLIVYQSSELKTSFELWSLVNPALTALPCWLGWPDGLLSAHTSIYVQLRWRFHLSFFSLNLAATYSPTPSPVQYHRPSGS